MDDRVSDDVARTRFLVINAVRIAGTAMVVIGLLVVGRAIPEPIWAGYVMIAVGFADLLIVPQILARKWRSPTE